MTDGRCFPPNVRIAESRDRGVTAASTNIIIIFHYRRERGRK